MSILSYVWLGSWAPGANPQRHLASQRADLSRGGRGVSTFWPHSGYLFRYVWGARGIMGGGDFKGRGLLGSFRLIH